MLVYSAATLLSCLLVWRVQKHGQERLVQKRSFWMLVEYVLCALPLLIVSAARWGIGTDFYCTYLPEFRALQWLRKGGGEALRDQLFADLAPRLAQWNLPDTPQTALEHFLGVLDKSEPGFRALMELDVWLGGSFRIVIGATAIVTTCCVFYAIFTQSSQPVLAVYLYVATSGYFLSLNIVRQYVAVGVGLISVRFIRERRLFPFLVCVGIGMLFHTSAILLLPCYFLCRVELRPLYALTAVGLVLVCAGPLGALAAWLMPHVGLGYYTRYLNSAWAEDGFETILFAINLCVMVFCGWYWNKAKQRSPYYYVV